MKIAISTARQAHYRLAANSFLRHGNGVTVYTTTPRSRMKGFDSAVQFRFVPAPVTLFNAVTRIPPPVSFYELDSTLYDKFAAMSLGECALFLGASSSSLSTGKTAQRHGGLFVLDRACPDIRVQQAMMIEEGKKTGSSYKAHSPWFLERQVAEYEQADYILSPSNYSKRSFPPHLQQKIVLAPLYGRSHITPRTPRPPDAPFTVGVVGGEPLRKGYLYLLQAWKELNLPNAQLKIRTGKNIYDYPVLKKLLAEQPSVSIISYVPDISTFYASCDAFILPSIDDGFGMALFEALANGVPSIATRNCGASELLAAGQDALMIDAFSVEQIKESLLTLYENTDLRHRLEQAGPAAVARLQQGDSTRLYDEGIVRLLAAAQGSSLAAV